MRISFDIDDTLICHGRNAPIEISLVPKFFSTKLHAPLRKAAAFLIRELRRQGCSVWIYTSSSRTPFEIHLWLFLYGIRVDGVVNDARHRKAIAGRNFYTMPSKYPPAFDIDLHVDDSEGVRMEGEEHGFRVVVVNPNDDRWVHKVLDAINVVKQP